MYCFFFSSRRRHTRSLCDWSSDVCSSDLSEEAEKIFALVAARRRPEEIRKAYNVLRAMFGRRSEEHTSELQSHSDLVCRLLLEKKNTAHVRRRHARIAREHCARQRGD